MAQEALARTFTTPDMDEQDYQSLLALLSETARGRAFLAEHARRSRMAEAEALRSALTQVDERLGELLGPQTAASPRPALEHLVELLEPAPREAPSPTAPTAAPSRAPLAALMALTEDERLALFS